MDSVGTRRPCFIEGDNGLASLAEVKAGFSGNHNQNNYALLSRPLSYGRTSLRNLSSLSSSSVCSSPRSGPRFYDARFEEQQPHFLDVCFLCKKPLGNRRHLHVQETFRFCTEECRQEIIEDDEAKEKKRSLSSSMKAMMKKEQQRKSTSPNKNQDYSCRTGTVAAA